MKLRLVYLMLGTTACLLLALPPGERWMLPCPLHALTGLECPFCGGQRMVRALLHADWATAYACNPFLLLSLPLPAAWLLCYFLPVLPQRLPLFRRICSVPAFFLYLTAALLWGIARNL